MPKRWIELFAVLLIAALSTAHGQEQAPDGDDGYVGSAVCAGCHQREFDLWRGSHHDLAMQVADQNSVLGDFDDAVLIHFGVQTRFYRDDGRYMVETEGPEGTTQFYTIEYTFGAVPLQQYLVRFPGGRLQALGVAWDSRPETQGGQRWFHLYPDKLEPGDPLHWTGADQNWNYMCADCHSTNLRRRYDPENDSYDTRWSEINVACEACHGPGAKHREWAEIAQGQSAVAADNGLSVSFPPPAQRLWVTDPVSRLPRLEGGGDGGVELEVCAPCHSRRATIWGDNPPGAPFLDGYLPQLLREGMYFPDGQIRDEVYVYGSFLQSRMHDAGVTCSDCHEPHSLQLRLPDDGVCLQCHRAEGYQSETHHFHAAEATPVACVDCHMPDRTYMVVDPRRDHSFRIPRPDLSARLGVPDACTGCHRDRSPEWAAEQLVRWYGHRPVGYQDFADTFAHARSRHPGAGRELAALATDPANSSFARASALSELGGYLSASTLDAVLSGVGDDDPLVRVAALEALESGPLEVQVRLAFPLLSDPSRAVRIEAARLLAPVPRGELTGEQSEVLEAASREYEQAQLVNAERPEAQLNLGNYYAARGRLGDAESALRRAIELQSTFVPAYVNLADLYRVQDREREGEALLERAIDTDPQSADLHHALGLLLIRAKQSEPALEHIAKAARLDRDNARYGYVFGVALQSLGRSDEAIRELQLVYERHPYDRATLAALASYLRDSGRVVEAAEYAERLQSLGAPQRP